MNKNHALFSPSSSDKWFNCSASLAMEINLPDEIHSKYAIEGILAHKLAEKILKNLLYINKQKKYGNLVKKRKIKAVDYINISYSFFNKKNKIIVTKEMAEHVQKYVDKIWQMSKNYKLIIEHKINFSSFLSISKQFGTADAIIIRDNELQIHDLKYGFLKVCAKNNKQLQLYALGALKKFSKINKYIDTIRICIHQPRLNYISEWITNSNDLFFFGKQAKLAAAAASFAIDVVTYKGSCNYLSKNMYSPGEKQCRWCKAAGGKCKAEALYNIKKIENINKLQKIKENNILSSKELVSLYKKTNKLNKFVISLKKRITTELINGKKIPGVQLIRGQPGPRIWTNELLVKNILQENLVNYEKIYKEKLISPAQVEKITSKNLPNIWNKLKKLIIRSKGKLTAVLDKN